MWSLTAFLKALVLKEWRVFPLCFKSLFYEPAPNQYYSKKNYDMLTHDFA